MDFKKFGIIILVLGMIIAIVGIIQFSENEPKKFNRSESKSTIFGGRNDLGNMLEVNETNMIRQGKRKKATNLIVIGGIVAFVGIGMAFASKKKQTIPYKVINEVQFCPNCGKKLNSDATFCPECGKKIV